ncbi:MAG TPA: glycosyl transferase, partial [Candidatus Omnitrophota bacterium]|nr:glycosyl transferase [Candidatus Omnitrophota bacterium]
MFLSKHLFHSASKEPAELVRAELFSIERLEQHAESLAQAQRITRKRFKGRTILGRVRDNSRALSSAHHRITQNIRDERAITPAAEWFVDNFHVIEEQILEIQDDLPPKFYRGLPKLKEGPLKGTPRVYGVAWAFVAHTDSRFDPDWLRRFVRAYQRVDPLTIGELWALAISLRIVLIENLRRLVDRLLHSKAERLKADTLADSLLGLKGRPPADFGETLRHFEKQVLDKSFAVQLVLRLRDQGESMAPVMQWLDKQLGAQETVADDIIRMEHQEQAAMNATARNIITSMRLVSALDWAQFFEDVSVVDEILRDENRFS